MDHLHHDLGHQAAGTPVTIRLAGNAANVRLLDDHNYRSYQRRGRVQFVGGHYTRPLVRLATPSAGRWHVVIDLGGRRGRVGATVSVGR